MQSRPESTADFYKIGHHGMEPEGLEQLFNNQTPRSSKLAKQAGYDTEEIVWVGVNYYIQDFLIDKWNKEFFSQPKAKAISRYKTRMDTSLGPDSVSTSAIEELWELGYLPIEIRSLPEGSRVPVRVAPMVTYATDKKYAWLVNYLESIQSCYTWMPSTNATIADLFYQLFEEYAELTGGDKAFVPFQGHDFSFRGMSSYQSAMVSGMSHLLAGFAGTDTIPAIDGLEDYYDGNPREELLGCSVVASEHSIACINIAVEERKHNTNKREAERKFLSRYLDLYKTVIASYVSDTYDYFGLLTDIVPSLKDQILNRTGKLVLRPDSGDPLRIVCGDKIDSLDIALDLDDAKEYAEEILVNLVAVETPHGERGDSQVEQVFSYDGKYYKAVVDIEWNRHDKVYYYIDGSRLISFDEVELTPEQKGSIQLLWETFGGTINEKGFKVLDPHIGLIYGDSITYKRAKAILSRLAEMGFCSTNIVFGIGSYTYQYNTRDTFGWAIKATYGEVNGEAYDIYKDPKTDGGTKRSAKGLIAVYEENGTFIQKDQVTWNEVKNCAYQLAFSNSVQANKPTASEVRKRVRG